MDKAAPLASSQNQTGKRGTCSAYLIAVHQKREALRVYAVCAPSAETALVQLEALTVDGLKIEVVGALSRDLTRSLGLKPGEMRLI